MVSAEFVERCLPLLGIKNCFSHKRKEKNPRRNGIGGKKKKETLSRTVSAYKQPKHRSTHTTKKKKREREKASLWPPQRYNSSSQDLHPTLRKLLVPI